MIKKFFHSLNAAKVSYILISGQATVLYGAAAFSEDIDLWVEPNSENWNKFLKVINNIGAKMYKLTPPISMEFIKKGHGFHFQIPLKNRKFPVWFLDVMGVVPRIGDFKNSFKNVKYKKTDWGKIPVIGIRDLVEIKKTRRLEDYPIISNLVRIEYGRLQDKKMKVDDWKWILSHSYEIEDILYYMGTNKIDKTIISSISRKCLPYCIKSLREKSDEDLYKQIAFEKMALEIEESRHFDRKYWEPIIGELKDLKEQNKLFAAGSKPPHQLFKGVLL